MDKFEKLYNQIVKFIEHCIDQDFIPEDEEDYILGNIEKIKEDILSEE